MSSGHAKPSLFLLDAHALIFQVFHAIPEMSSPGGLPTNALFGFTRDVLFLKTQKKPDFLVCAFDEPGPTFRDAIYPAYKAGRGPMPDDLVLQIPLIHQMLEAMRVPVVTLAGFEADDLIATLATAGAQRDLDVAICSSDKDCRQLLSERIHIYNLRKQQVFDRETLLKEWGITPEQVIDFQTLVGDSVDNVPGVPGIGPKTAAKLLQDYQTLDNLIAHLEEIPGKKKESLQGALATLEMSRTLVRLRTDVPVEMTWDAWRLAEWDAPLLLALFKEWGFRGFAEQVRSQSGVVFPAPLPSPVTPSPRRRAVAEQGSLFPEEEGGESPRLDNENGNGQPFDDWQAMYYLVDTASKLESFLAELRQQERFAIDLETTGLEPRRAQIVGYAFAWKPGEGWYLPVRGPEGAALLDPDTTLAALKPILEAPQPSKVNQNIKYDLLVLRGQGVDVKGVVGDPMVAHYLLHAGERNRNMEALAREYLHHQVIPITDLIGKRGKKQLCMDEVATARVAEYSGEDADVALRLDALFEPELSRQSLKKLYDEVEVPLIAVLAELEFNGVRLDLALLARLSAEMTRQLAVIEQDIHRLAGREFNINSLKQLREILFDDMKLRVKRKTGISGAASTDQETLEWLADQGHELPRRLVEQRRIAKLKGTYIDALPVLVNPATSRIHASFNQTVAATGRLSSSDPNLQNIPIRSEQGEQIRQAFIPEDGWVLLTADYSQIELRLLAHFCGDAALRQTFLEDGDIHNSVAAQIYSVPPSEVTKEMRRTAKTVNFGIIYGMSAVGLALRLGIPRMEATAFIDAYFARYPLVKEYQTRLLANCRANGYVSTILGRRRAITGIRANSTYQQRNQPEREAINMEIQGSAADLIKVAMLNIHRRLKRERRQARMLLQIHDELVFEAPPEELSDVADLVHHEMTGALGDVLQVPIKVDLAAGPNWLDVEELIPQRHDKARPEATHELVPCLT